MNTKPLYKHGRSYSTPRAQKKLDETLALFVKLGGTATVSQIQAHFDCSRSTAYLYASVLAERGRLEQLEDGSFRVPGTGPEARIARLSGLLREARELLEALNETTARGILIDLGADEVLERIDKHLGMQAGPARARTNGLLASLRKGGRL